MHQNKNTLQMYEQYSFLLTSTAETLKTGGKNSRHFLQFVEMVTYYQWQKVHHAITQIMDFSLLSIYLYFWRIINPVSRK